RYAWLRMPRAFFAIDLAPPHIYTLSLHDALPICAPGGAGARDRGGAGAGRARGAGAGDPPGRDPGAEGARLRPARRGLARLPGGDRKSTRLNSSHVKISYAVFCLKKKKKQNKKKN